METKIKVSEITETLETVKQGDIVKSIYHGCIILVVETHDSGRSFDGILLDPANHVKWEAKDFVKGFATESFEPFKGTVTLESK